MLQSAASTAHILSRSQLRRRRALATKQNLYEAARKPVTLTGIQEQLESLTLLVSNLHSFLGGAVVHVPCFMPAFGTGMDLQADSMYCDGVNDACNEQGCTKLIDSKSEDEDGDLILWQPGREAFINKDSPLLAELQHEAALLIQRSFRHRYQDHPDSQSMVSETEVCGGCGETFKGNAHGADSCDRCGSPHHAACLRSVAHPVTPYRICKACVASGDEVVDGDPAPGECIDEELMVIHVSIHEFQKRFYPVMSLDCIRKYHMHGLRDYTDRTWYQICDSRSTTSCNHSAYGTASLKPKASQAEEDPCKPLETTLEYMVRFLEGEHTQSGNVSGPQREYILQHIKAAMDWKSRCRSTTEVQAKVEELNAMMIDIMQQL